MFKNIFSFHGRIRRTEYGISYIFYCIIYLVILLLTEGNSGIKILVLIYIPLLWFILAQNAKRCHDLEKSGWWQIIPFYGLWLLFQSGTVGENEYGDDPKAKVGFNPDEYAGPFPSNGNTQPDIGISDDSKDN